MSYQQSRGAGNRGEDFVRDVLSRAGVETEKNVAKDKRQLVQWDLKGNCGREFTVEVKYDMMAARTGNLAVEYFNVKQGKPSGIDATTADLWAYVLNDPKSCWLARTRDFREYVGANKPLRDVPCGGDDNAAIKLYRKDELLDAVFRRVDELDPWDLTSLLKTLLETE
jgi:hypothetical protein